MNKLVFALLLGLLITACQNTPKTAETAAPAPDAAPAAPAAPAPEKVAEAATNLSSNVKMMEDLHKQVDALPANVKKQKAAEIDAINADLEGMMEKQNAMLAEIKAAAAGAAAATAGTQESESTQITTATLSEYSESAQRYAKEAQAIQEKLSNLGKKN